MRKIRRATTEEGRWNQAIDRLLNSGTMYSYMEDFWKFIDGELTWKEFDQRMPT